MTREFPKNNPPENSSPKIERPTVGRIVLVYVPAEDTQLAAIVAKVYLYDDLMINACVVYPDGLTGPMQQIKHVSVPRHDGDPYWDWMAYQKGQARKVEELEAQLKTSTFAPVEELDKR